MEHAFGSSSPFSLGIEEEFQLVSRLVERGTGDEQPRTHVPVGSLLSVARWLAEEKVPNVGSRAVGYPPDRLAPSERAPSCFQAV